MRGKRSGTVHAWVGQRQVTCLICEADVFGTRQIKLNTSGAEFLGLAWANRSATGLICISCGYVHEFVGDRLQPQRTD